MDTEIIVAIITAGGAVLVAVIAGIFNLINKDSGSSNSTNIRQSQKGKNNTQIGIQNNYTKEDKKDNE